MVQLVNGDIAPLEGRARAALHGLIVLTEASNLPQPQGHQVGIPLVDLFANENFQPRFLGINPRGVHDGAVHIESNDIIQYLETEILNPKANSGWPRE